MKKPKLFAVILYGLLAVLWTVRTVIAVIYREYDPSVFLFILYVLSALIWIAAFIVNLIRYRSGKEQ